MSDKRGLRVPDGTKPDREHINKRGTWLEGHCTCHRTPSGERVYVCQRSACRNRAQTCGGYCAPCFKRRMACPPRPEVVVLCGSTRFSEAWVRARFDLTLAGKIVLTIGCDTKSDDGLALTAAQKADLDELHKRKIDLADRVLVLNVDGYIGDSTRSEIAYAEWWDKPIDYLVAPAVASCGATATEGDPQP